MKPQSCCRCEAKCPPDEKCGLCMNGAICTNTTYEHNGKTYQLLDATLLWASSSWDGVMSGIAVYKGFVCYTRSFTMYKHRTFWLYPLSSAEWGAELVYHAQWIKTKGPDLSRLLPPNRDLYLEREPLGFFRIKPDRDPMNTNRIIHKIVL